MGRRQGESVVARFTSFGCSSFTKTISRKSSNGGGVELQRRHGSSVVQHLSINDTEHFPPLAASVLTKRAPLFGPPIPPELVRGMYGKPFSPGACTNLEGWRVKVACSQTKCQCTQAGDCLRENVMMNASATCHASTSSSTHLPLTQQLVGLSSPQQ